MKGAGASPVGQVGTETRPWGSRDTAQRGGVQDEREELRAQLQTANESLEAIGRTFSSMINEVLPTPPRTAQQAGPPPSAAPQVHVHLLQCDICVSSHCLARLSWRVLLSTTLCRLCHQDLCRCLDACFWSTGRGATGAAGGEAGDVGAGQGVRRRDVGAGAWGGGRSGGIRAGAGRRGGGGDGGAARRHGPLPLWSAGRVLRRPARRWCAIFYQQCRRILQADQARVQGRSVQRSPLQRSPLQRPCPTERVAACKDISRLAAKRCCLMQRSARRLDVQSQCAALEWQCALQICSRSQQFCSTIRRLEGFFGRVGINL